MKTNYPTFKKGQVEGAFLKFPKKEQAEIEEYVQYRQARGVTSDSALSNIRRHIIQLRYIFEKPLVKLNLKDLRAYLAIVTKSNNLKIHTKNDIKIDVKNFIKWKFKDWSIRFSELDDIKLTSDYRNEEKINSKAILTKEDIEKFVKTEPRLFWKAFFVTQLEGGLRTKEARLIKWQDIKFDTKIIDNVSRSSINIFATKTKRARTIFVQNASFFLKKLRDEQEQQGKKGIYVFHSKNDINKPVDKNAISRWMRALSKNVGKPCWPYLLRHSRATELYKLAEQNKISKDVVLRFMGHSEDMSKTYTHLDEKDVEEMLNQVYEFEDLPPEQKAEFEKRIEVLQKETADVKKAFEEFKQQILSKKLVVADEFEGKPDFCHVISVKDRIAKKKI
jgi:integrase